MSRRHPHHRLTLSTDPPATDAAIRPARDRASVGQLETLAAKQSGCLHHHQVLAVVSRHVFNQRLARGRYQRIHPNVVRLAGLPDSPTARAWAGVLSVGQPTAVAGMSAALLHGIRDAHDDGEVSLIVPPNRRAPSRPRLTVRRVSDWSDRSFTTRSGLVVSSLADTVIDLAVLLPPGRVTPILEQLLWRRLRPEDVYRRLRRGREGSAAVRLALDQLSDGHRSIAERRVSGGLRRRQVPRFETNVVIRDDRGRPVAELDLLWRALRVVVQIDGWRYHEEGTFQQDHDVPNDLIARHDYVVLRFTGKDVKHRLDWVLDQIEVVLRRQALRLGLPYAA